MAISDADDRPGGTTAESITGYDRTKKRKSSDDGPKSKLISELGRCLSAIKWYLLDQWFLVAVGLAIVIASQVQVPEAHQHRKETVVAYLCVSIIFLVTGCTLSTKTLLQNYSKWKIHLFVQLQCYLMTSALIFGIVSVCATNPRFMDGGLLIGMIVMGCVPTTISSNVVMTRQAHGNQALTVVESTLGNFLGPFLTPVLVRMYTSSEAWYTKTLPPDSGGFGAIYRRVFMQLGLSLFLPLVRLVRKPLNLLSLNTSPGSRSAHSKLVPWTNTKDICKVQARQNRLALPCRHHLVRI